MRGGRLALAATLAAGALSIVAGASAGSDDAGANEKAQVKDRGHILWHPQLKREFALRKQAIRDKLAGKAKGKVHQVANGQFVELELERTDRVFVILAEFGNARHPSFPDLNPDNRATPAQAGFDGPLRNKIPPPDRSVDNSTLWKADYNKAHFQDMYFNRMAQYYKDQSSGRGASAGLRRGSSRCSPGARTKSGSTSRARRCPRR